MLTRKQLDALIVINHYIEETGVAPSYEELRILLGKKSKSAVYHLIVALEHRGYLRRIKNRARAIELLRLPPSVQFAGPGPANAASTSIAGIRTADVNRPESIELELMGSIAAGSPAEAIHDTIGSVTVPADLVSSGSEHFALRVVGESMINAGILNNDIVIIRRQQSADFGSIVVALVQGVEATLKRIRKSGSGILLQAANPSLPDQWYRSDEVEVLGQLVGLFRSY